MKTCVVPLMITRGVDKRRPLQCLSLPSALPCAGQAEKARLSCVYLLQIYRVGSRTASGCLISLFPPIASVIQMSSDET